MTELIDRKKLLEAMTVKTNKIVTLNAIDRLKRRVESGEFDTDAPDLLLERVNT